MQMSQKWQFNLDNDVVFFNLRRTFKKVSKVALEEISTYRIRRLALVLVDKFERD